MKFAYTMPLILGTLLFFSGCSQEEPDNNQGKNVVRMKITKPTKDIKTEKDVNIGIADIVQKDIDQRINQETVQVDVLPATETGEYVTEEGDTLSGISGRANINNNPLKWTFLYRNNVEALSSIKGKGNLYERPLPAGIRLKITSPEEKNKNLDAMQKAYYTVNALSSPSLEEVGPHAVKLIEAGYYVYIANVIVREKAYYRLRAGFYKTRSETGIEGEKIKKILNITDIWTAKIDDAEFSEFGGY
ncbi:MAG: hypothetical protein GX654_02330 [Desulfatiglans sp.]|nr:hypothetical protein [Desulfatiglans sp.]